MPEQADRIKVVVRVRPVLPAEEEEEVVVSVTDIDTVVVRDVETSTRSSTPTQATHTFNFDRCYSSTDGSQETVFEDLGSELVANALEGYNDTLFAYGQTGAGKTHSIIGQDGDHHGEGLLPRLIRRCFEKLNEKEEQCNCTFTCVVSYVEIYKETLKDLLLPAGAEKKPLDIHHHPKFGVFIPGLSECVVRSEEEAMELLQTGLRVRSVAATAMNDRSSRSHCLFTFSIAQDLGNDSFLRAKVNVVDLAGSERQNHVDPSGPRFREGTMINTSLSSLALVIQSLLTNGKTKGKSFIPFRNSKLTHILQESLGGNSKTVMIAAVSPVHQSAKETIGTLRFATSVKKVATKAIKNEGSKQNIVDELQAEVRRLKIALQKCGENSDMKANLLRCRRSSLLLTDKLLKPNHTIDLPSLRRSLSTVSTATAVLQHTAPRLRNVSHDRSLCGKLEYVLCSDEDCDDRPWDEVVIGSSPMCHVELQGLGIQPVMAAVRTILKENGVQEVFITRLAKEGRVLVNGRLIPRDVKTAISHGDRIIFGQAFVCTLMIPALEEVDIDIDINQAISEVEPETLTECKDVDAYSNFLRDAMTRFGDVRGPSFIAECKKVFSAVAEANDISDAVRRNNTMKFSVSVGRDLSDTTPVLFIRVQNTDGSSETLWTMTQFYERLHFLREAYEAFSTGTSPPEASVDPWHDSSYSDLLEMVHEIARLRQLTEKVATPGERPQHRSSRGPRGSVSPSVSVRKGSNAEANSEWKEKNAALEAERNNLAAELEASRRLVSEWKERCWLATLKQCNAQDAERAERERRKLETERREKTFTSRAEECGNGVSEVRERKKMGFFGVPKLASSPSLPLFKPFAPKVRNVPCSPTMSLRDHGPVRQLSFTSPHMRTMLYVPSSPLPCQRIVSDPVRRGDRDDGRVNSLGSRCNPEDRLRELLSDNKHRGVLDRVVEIIEEMKTETNGVGEAETVCLEESLPPPDVAAQASTLSTTIQHLPQNPLPPGSPMMPIRHLPQSPLPPGSPMIPSAWHSARLQCPFPSSSELAPNNTEGSNSCARRVESPPTPRERVAPPRKRGCDEHTNGGILDCATTPAMLARPVAGTPATPAAFSPLMGSPMFPQMFTQGIHLGIPRAVSR